MSSFASSSTGELSGDTQTPFQKIKTGFLDLFRSEAEIELDRQVRTHSHTRKMERQQNRSAQTYQSRLQDINAKIAEYDAKITDLGVSSRNPEGVTLEHLQLMQGMLQTQRETILTAIQHTTMTDAQQLEETINLEILEQMKRSAAMHDATKARYSPEVIQRLAQDLMVFGKSRAEMTSTLRGCISSLVELKMDPQQRAKNLELLDEQTSRMLTLIAGTWPRPIGVRLRSPLAMSMGGHDPDAPSSPPR